MSFYKITYSAEEKRAGVWNHGCNFKCRGCSLAIPGICFEPEKDRFLDSEEIKSTLIDLKIRNGLERVHFLGGEPTIEPTLPELVEFTHNEIQAHTRLITNGFNYPPEGIDSVSMSIKAYTNELHKEYTGRSNCSVLRNFIEICNSGMDLKASSVFIPNYIEYDEIEKIARFVASINKNIAYHIIGYIPIPASPWKKLHRKK